MSNPARTIHQVLPAAELGGGNLVALDLSGWLGRNGAAVQVWVPGEGAAAEDARARGLQLALFDARGVFGRGRLRPLLANWRISRRFRRQPGLIHVHSQSCYGAMSWGLRRSGLARVLHIHLEVPDQGLRWALQRPPELIVTCARFLTDQVRRCLPEAVREKQRIESVPNSVDLDRFRPGCRQEARQRAGVAGDWPLMLMLANLAPHKGQETAIRAAGLLKQRGIGVLCWLAGEERGGTTAYRDRLRQLIVEQGVEDRVTLLGFRKDAPDLLRAADFFLLPSTNEGLPLTVLEAQAAKIPVLASATAGIPEVVRDGETGFLISPREPHSYAACIERLLREPDLRSRVTEQAFEFVTREHSWQKYRERIHSLYRQLLPQLPVLLEK